MKVTLFNLSDVKIIKSQSGFITEFKIKRKYGKKFQRPIFVSENK